MAAEQSRGGQHSNPVKVSNTAQIGDEEDADRSSYEELRDKRVAKMKKMMKLLVKAKKNW